MRRTGSTELSRRVLLLRASRAAGGAVTILGTGIRAATAAKVSQTAASYQTSPKGARELRKLRAFPAPERLQHGRRVHPPGRLVQPLFEEGVVERAEQAVPPSAFVP